MLILAENKENFAGNSHLIGKKFICSLMAKLTVAFQVMAKIVNYCVRKFRGYEHYPAHFLPCI
jgi:hypothetical protein